MPALRMAMYQQRVALYCAPTADDRDSGINTMQHVAMEGRCFVLSSCQHLRRHQFSMEALNNRLPDAPDTALMRGGGCIIRPLGKVLAGPVYGEDALPTAEIDLDDIPARRWISILRAITRGPMCSSWPSTPHHNALCSGSLAPAPPAPILDRGRRWGMPRHASVSPALNTLST